MPPSQRPRTLPKANLFSYGVCLRDGAVCGDCELRVEGIPDGLFVRASIRLWCGTISRKFLGLPLNSVRVIVPYIGGGYGSKSYTKIEPLVAACSWKSGRPVQTAAERGGEEAFLTTRGDDARVRISHGCRRAGKTRRAASADRFT